MSSLRLGDLLLPCANRHYHWARRPARGAVAARRVLPLVQQHSAAAAFLQQLYFLCRFIVVARNKAWVVGGGARRRHVTRDKHRVSHLDLVRYCTVSDTVQNKIVLFRTRSRASFFLSGPFAIQSIRLRSSHHALRTRGRRVTMRYPGRTTRQAARSSPAWRTR